MLKPKYTITPEINSRIAKIEAIKTIISHSNILPREELDLRFRATVEAVYSSTTIEGNPLNKTQIKKVLSGQLITAPEYAIREVINYKKSLDWIDKYSSTKKEIALTSILDLHQITMNGLLPTEKVGRWRPGNIYIVDSDRGVETVQYTGPSTTKILPLIKNLLSWLKKQSVNNLHPILVAGILHFVFVSIHSLVQSKNGF